MAMLVLQHYLTTVAYIQYIAIPISLQAASPATNLAVYHLGYDIRQIGWVITPSIQHISANAY